MVLFIKNALKKELYICSVQFVCSLYKNNDNTSTPQHDNTINANKNTAPLHFPPLLPKPRSPTAENFPSTCEYGRKTGRSKKPKNDQSNESH